MSGREQRRRAILARREFAATIDEVIKRHLRRIRHLQDIKAGRVKAKIVPVQGHWVKRHYVGDHVRVL